MRKTLIGLTLASACVASPAAADIRDDSVARCMGDNSDLAIAGCTWLIASGRETTENLAVEFYNRGNAYYDQDDYDRAIADYSQAVRLRPDFAKAFINRGLAYEEKEMFDQAVADYRAALRIAPSSTGALKGLERLGATP
jgi:tetratricopeptide (TPR) repeat protein